jgi:G3E family GTPase
MFPQSLFEIFSTEGICLASRNHATSFDRKTEMEQLQIPRPRELDVKKRVQIVLIGGFLGAGKTTAISALAHQLRKRGLKSAVITNDQAPNLVDTAIVRSSGHEVEEVAGGCFCCKFTDLLGAVERAAQCEPDILLCEPVGSCADIAATVLNPLRYFYKETLQLAPLSVLVDPRRVREIILQDHQGRFPTEVSYIFDQQLREADVIVLTKADTLENDDRERLSSILETTYRIPVFVISSTAGDGIDDWIDFLMGDSVAGANTLMEMDYDTYAAGEAALGWLNATIEVTSDVEINADRLCCAVMDGIHEACSLQNAEIAHLKATIAGNRRMTQANLTATDDKPIYTGAKVGMVSLARITINARVHLDPGKLGGIVADTVQAAAVRFGASAIIQTLQCFSPPYPRPPFEIRESPFMPLPQASE